jgi:hypothetical protein
VTDSLSNLAAVTGGALQFGHLESAEGIKDNSLG